MVKLELIIAVQTESLDVTGNIAVSGTVDGVDIAAFKTSFDNLSTDIVSDTSPQLGGALDTNGNNITFADNVRIVMGDAGLNDSHIRWDGSVLHFRGNW